MLQTRNYSVKEFSAQPSKVLHRAMQREEEVVITLHGVPVVRLVPVEAAPAPPSIQDTWEALPDMMVAREPMGLPGTPYALRGEGPLASDLLLEDRR